MMKNAGIFERSVQDFSGLSPVSRPHSSSVSSVHSLASGAGRQRRDTCGCPFKPEDYIPPALDATASIIADKSANLDDVEMVYPSRRNSSVVGLSMALGGQRPRQPSRKNSLYSMSHLAESSARPSPPPKLTPSRSSLNFCSYVDVVQHDDRPAFKQSYSQGFIPKSPSVGVPNRPAQKVDASKFMISPEQSEAEDEDTVACTIGACLRNTTTELSSAEH
ncbi:hypothetical protein DICA3_F38204 [Diutina catenulata]